MGEAQKIEVRIREFMLQHFPLARKSGLPIGQKFLESGMVDSLGILDLVLFLEQEFGLQVSDEELSPENFDSLEAVSTFVRNKKDLGPASGEPKEEAPVSQ
jgi:acyl carrier protein